MQTACPHARDPGLVLQNWGKDVEVYNSYSFDSAFLVLVYYYPLCLSSLVLLLFVHSVLSHAMH